VRLELAPPLAEEWIEWIAAKNAASMAMITGFSPLMSQILRTRSRGNLCAMDPRRPEAASRGCERPGFYDDGRRSTAASKICGQRRGCPLGQCYKIRPHLCKLQTTTTYLASEINNIHFL
jgi:hypothetical protein